RLVGAAQSQGIGGNVLRDARASGDVRAGADPHRSDQGGIAADEGTFFDDGGVLANAVIVAGDGSGAHIHVSANIRVTKVSKMIGLGPFPQAGLLGLHEVADVGALANLAAGPQMRIWTEDGPMLHS